MFLKCYSLSIFFVIGVLYVSVQYWFPTFDTDVPILHLSDNGVPYTTHLSQLILTYALSHIELSLKSLPINVFSHALSASFSCVDIGEL